MKRPSGVACLIFGSAMLLISYNVFLQASASNSPSNAVTPALARLGENITVRAHGMGAPIISLSDGHEITTEYSGSPSAERLLREGPVEPLTAASADFDGDGIQDLITGYAAPNGGILTIHRGNPDAIYPNSLEAQTHRAAGAFTSAPFLSPALAFETSRPVDLIGCGDFDADGKMDVLTAARGGHVLFLFSGNGRGDLREPTQIEINGQITALVTGEINRADGLADIAVGVSGADGPYALVFESSDGALKSTPVAFALPAEPVALALGQLDDDFAIDLAVAAGRDIVVLHGKDHQSRLATQKVSIERADRRSFSSAIKSLAIGDFNGNRRGDIAALSADGLIHILRRAQGGSSRDAKLARIKKWQDEVRQGPSRDARIITGARISTLPTDDLIVVDPTNRRVEVLAQEPARLRSIRSAPTRDSLEVEGEPVAVLPMRLNPDALNDLVIIRRGQVSPSVVLTPAMSTFTVINTNDSGLGSLRQAMADANIMSPGPDVINFNIGSGPQAIDLLTPLPVIAESVVIDATTQPGFTGTPLIELDGSAIVSTGSGFVINGSGSTIRGFIIGGFPNDGISISTSASIVERNFIGLTSGGTVPNGGAGVSISGSSTNRIGGTSPTARNVISANPGGGVFLGTSSSNNLVQGNRIGTDASGTAALGNTEGVVLDGTFSNAIGGSSAGAGNLISGNFGNGVVVKSGSSNNLVQGNFIGTNVTGTTGLGNTDAGVRVMSGSGTTIGAAAGNRIAFNVIGGIVVQSGNGNLISANSIFSNDSMAGLGINLADDIVTPNDACDGDPGPNELQNFPVLTSANSNGASTTVVGTLDSTASTSFKIEFFASPGCSTSGFGEGQTFLGSTMVTTSAACTIPFTAVLPVGVGGGQSITATATDPTNNTSEFSQCISVISLGCTIECPANITKTAEAFNCGAFVSYAPILSGPCGPVSCNPPSGTAFPVGTTTVTCVVSGGPSCSFIVTVNDVTPPTIACPPTITANVPSGQTSAVVSYPSPPVGDNCFGALAQCVPPSGASFPLGTTNVTCTASDSSSNTSSCSFSIRVTDGEAPVIRCPANVSSIPPTGQTSSVVNYPAPTVSDNLPGATVVCAPSSGSSFPLGTTTVVCTATDTAGNKASCSFSVTVGGPQIRIIIPGGAPSVDFGTVSPARKVPKAKKNPCSTFTLQNIGFAPLVLTYDSIKRTGSDVTSGRISDPNDTNAAGEIAPLRFFTLSLVNADQSLTVISPGSTLTLVPGQSQLLCVKFAALIPAPAGKTTGLAASSVLPDIVTSAINFRQSTATGDLTVSVPLLARVQTGVVLIDPVDPRRPPVITFVRSGNDITISYAVFDSNLDVTRAKYEFLDSSGRVVGDSFEIDLAGPLRSLNLLRGQSFAIEQKFTGASSNPEVIGVRVTVFDGEGSAIGATAASGSVSVSGIQAARPHGAILTLPDMDLNTPRR